MGETWRIVVSDDHPLTRDAVAALLRRRLPGSRIWVADSLAAVRELAATHRPIDLFVLDLVMPGMDIAALGSLADAHPDARIAVLSSLMDDGHIVAARRAGADVYLTKDQPTEQVGDALLTLLGEDADGGQGDLTPREHSVLDLLSRGLSNKQIAAELGLKEASIKMYLSSVYRKLGVRNRVAAVNRWRALNPDRFDGA